MTNFANTTTNTATNTATNTTVPDSVDIHATDSANTSATASANAYAVNHATTTTLVQGIGFNDVKALRLPKTQHHTQALQRWRKMLERCTSHPAYVGVTIVDEWLTFSNFARWFETTVIAYGSTDFELDKDLMPLTRGLGSSSDRMKAPRVYSPDVCLPLSESLNSTLASYTNPQSTNEDRGILAWEREDGIVVYKARHCKQAIGTFSTLQEAAYTFVLERQRRLVDHHHQELKRLHTAGLIGLKGDTLTDVKRRIVAAVCPHSTYSIMEDKMAPIPRIKRQRGRPASTSPLRSHWVVEVNSRTGSRKKLKRYATAELAVEGLQELEGHRDESA